jgi:glycyl-tRNA synthetase alpha subunit
MRECRSSVPAKGRPYLDYLINKTEAFISHLEMTQFAADGIAAYADAFLQNPRDEAQRANALVAAEQLFVKAQQQARETARIFAQRVDHPSDLGILFLANVFNIQKADRIAELVHRVVCYHQGKPYWPES